MRQRGSGWSAAIVLLVIAVVIAGVVYWWLRASGYHGAVGPSANYTPNIVPGAKSGAGIALPSAATLAGHPPIAPPVPGR